jgi:hypothetical protein
MVLLIGATTVRAFDGDIATWTGVPDLPPTAADMPKPGYVHCSVGAVTGQIISIWLPRADCVAWIKRAQEMSAKGPSIREINEYRIHQCLARFAGQMQSYSGQFYTYCAQATPLLR